MRRGEEGFFIDIFIILFALQQVFVPADLIESSYQAPLLSFTALKTS
jgi:hypothetical protein